MFSTTSAILDEHVIHDTRAYDAVLVMQLFPATLLHGAYETVTPHRLQ
jgi:hypothetical protein